MLLPALAWLCLSLQEDRLEEVLPSGATILAERMEGAQSMSIALVGKAVDTPETPKTHGWRHLIEHIVAKGPHKDLDKRLEAVGGYLYAQTNRDTMAFRIDAPVTESVLVQKLAAELVSPLRTDEKEIATEIKVIREEIALIPASRFATIAAWAKVYGDSRLDPLGDAEVMATAKVSDLSNLFKTMFCTKNLIVSVCGPGDPKAMLETARAIAEEAPKAPEIKYAQKEGPGAAPVYAEVGDAVAVGVPVDGFFERNTVAKVAAGMAFAAQGHGEFFFTPSARSGLVSCAFAYEADLLRAARTTPDQGLYQLGLQRAKGWINGQLSSPGPRAQFRATLLATLPFYRPEAFLEEVDQLSFGQFQKAYRELAEVGK